MELLILDTDLNIVDIVDTFESLIWTERYNAYGDFEIYAKVSDKLVDLTTQEYYIKVTDSNCVMIIEDCKIESDAETGSHITILGRSYESVIDRRIIWAQTVLTGSLQNGIKKLIDENVISPSITERIIPNISFELSSDILVTALTINMQFTRDNLYESVKALCVASNIGFRITLLDDLSGFVFQLYAGVDRSYEQFDNPYVVFSQEFDNIISSNYNKTTSTLKTLTVVGGEGEGTARKIKIVGVGDGLARREMYTDARDLSQTVDGVLQSDAVYYTQLEQRGIQDLDENAVQSEFDSQVDATRSFKLGVDFFLGDIVQIVSEYGISSKARVTEIIRSQNTSGIDIYPKFKIIE